MALTGSASEITYTDLPSDDPKIRQPRHHPRPRGSQLGAPRPRVPRASAGRLITSASGSPRRHRDRPPLLSRPLLEAALRAADAGARAIRPFMGGDFSVQTKADNSPVTDADLAAHTAIGAILRAERPDLPVVSEEATADERADAARGRGLLVRGSARRHQGVCRRPPHVHGQCGARGGRTDTTGRGDRACARRGVLGRRRPGVRAPGLQLSCADPRASGRAGRAAWCSPAAPPARTRSTFSTGPRLRATAYSRRPTGRRSSRAASRRARPTSTRGSGPTHEWDTAASQAILGSRRRRLVTADGTPLTYGKPGLLNPNVFAWGDPALSWRAWLDEPA